MTRLARLVALWSVLGVGCAGGEGESRDLVGLRLYHVGGAGLPEAFPPAVTLRVVAVPAQPAAGEPAEPLREGRWEVTARGADLDSLPEEVPLVLLVEGLEGGGRPVFTGGAGPLVVPKVARAAKDYAVLLSRVGDINPAPALAAGEVAGVVAVVEPEGSGGRAGAAGVALADGRALVVGGGALDGGGLPSSLVDVVVVSSPQTGQLEVAKDEAGGAVRLRAPRALHTATALPDGRVLVAGGYGLVDGEPQALRSTEWLEPLPGGGFLRLDGPPMAEARARHTATLRADGSVLVAGGERLVVSAEGAAAREGVATVELFSPAADGFTVAAAMAGGRTGHAAALTQDGEGVLLLGGAPRGGAEPLATVELFRFDEAGRAEVAPWEPLALAREGLGAAPLATAPGRSLSGRYVAVIGGRGPGGAAVGEVELWDVATRRLVSMTPLNVPRADFAWALAGDGRSVAVFGGLDTARQPTDTAEWLTIDAAQGVFSARLLGSRLSAGRVWPAVVTFPYGVTWLVGGQAAPNAPLTTVDAFNAGLPAPWASAPPDP